MPNRLTDIQLWKADRSSRISTPESLYNSLASPPHFKDVFGLKSEVQLTLYAGCRIATASEGESYRLSQGKIIRFIYDDGQIKEYRIKQGNREFSGQSDRTVTAKSIENDLQSVTVRKTLANGHARASVSFYQQSFSDIAGKLLSSEYNCPDHFELGNVPASFDEDTYNLNLSGAYLIAGLKELCSNAGGEWKVSYNAAGDKYQVDFYESEQMGGGKDEAGQRILGIGGGKGNRLKMNRQDERDRYFSRIVPLMGQENQTRTMAGAKWDVKAAAFNDPNSEVALSDRAIAKDGYGLIQGETVYFGNEAEGYFEIQATTAPNGLTLAGDASGLSYGYFKSGANKDDIVFLEDAQALENIGLKEEKFARTDIGPYANLVEDAGVSAALSEWSNGMPEGFNNITGNETVSQESNDLFVKHGVLSAKVQANTDEGIETIAIDIEPEELSPYFSLQTYLQCPQGSVRIEIEDSQGNIYPTDETAETNSPETIGLAIGGEEIPAGTATIKFIANEDNTVFYVDALAFTQSGSPQPYKPLMGPRALWMEAGRYLKRYGGDRPDVWQGEGMDNAFFDGGKEIEIGSWVTVQEDYNEDTGEYDTEKVLRVIELSYDEHRINGRFRKTVKLASERSSASRFFQDQFVTKDDLQAGVSVDQIPNKGLYDRGEQERLDGLLGDLDQNLGDLNQQLGNLDDQINAPGGLNDQLGILNTQINGTGGLDERLEDTESHVSTLQTNLGDLDTDLGSLDTILGDPLGNGLTSDQWFESIATNQAWINKFVANEGYMREATIKDAYIEEITLDQGFFNSLAGSELWANTGTFNNAFVDNITGNSAFFDNLVTSDLWSETATFDQAFIDVMSSNKIWSDQVVANTMFAKDLSVYNATLGNWEAFTNTIESVDQFQGIRMNSADPEIAMLTPNVAGTDEYDSLIVSPTAPIPSSVDQVMSVSNPDTSGVADINGRYFAGPVDIADSDYEIIINYEVEISNVNSAAGTFSINLVIEGDATGNGDWEPIDVWDVRYYTTGDSDTFSVEDKTVLALGYERIRAGIQMSRGDPSAECDYEIIGQTFEQYKSKVVINEKGGFQMIAPHIIRSFGGGSGDTVIANSTGSSYWGKIGGTLSDQSDLQNALNDKLDITDGASRSSGFLSGNAKLAFSGFMYAEAILHTGETGSGPAGIVFGNGDTYGNDAISLVTHGAKRVYVDANAVNVTHPLVVEDAPLEVSRSGGPVYLRLGRRNSYDHDGLRFQSHDEDGNWDTWLNVTTGASVDGSNKRQAHFHVNLLRVDGNEVLDTSNFDSHAVRAGSGLDASTAQFEGSDPSASIGFENYSNANAGGALPTNYSGVVSFKQDADGRNFAFLKNNGATQNSSFFVGLTDNAGDLHWSEIWHNRAGDSIAGSNLNFDGNSLNLNNIPSVYAIDLANREMDSYTESGRLYHDESAGVYVKSVNANHDNPALLWSSANFTDGSNLTVSYGSENEPTLSVVDNPIFDGRVRLAAQGTADSDTDYGSADLEFEVSAYDTNNGYQRTNHWVVQGEGHASVYPDMNLVFRSPSGKVKAFELYGRGSTGDLPDTVAEFYGNVTLDNLYLSGDIQWNNGELTSGDNNTGARIIARALSNPSDGHSIFAVESYGGATRLGVTQNYGMFLRDNLRIGYNHDDGIIDFEPNYRLDVNGAVRADSIFVPIFRPNTIRGMGGEFIFNASSTIDSVDGSHEITVKDPVFSDSRSSTSRDWVVISGSNNGAPYNIRCRVASVAGDGVTLTLDNYSGGSYSDIKSGDYIVRINGSPIYVNANDDNTSYDGQDVYPFIEGYKDIGGTSGGPFNNPNPQWRIGELTGFPNIGGTSPSGVGLAAQNVYLKGVIEAGSGTVTLDDDGLKIDQGQDFLQNGITWNQGNTAYAEMYAYYSDYNDEVFTILRNDREVSNAQFNIVTEHLNLDATGDVAIGRSGSDRFIRLRGFPRYNVDFYYTSSSGEATISAKDPVVAVDCPNDPRFYKIDIEGVNAEDGMVLYVIARNRFHFRDERTANNSGGNIRCNNDADYEVFPNTMVTLVRDGGNWYVGMDYGS